MVKKNNSLLIRELKRQDPNNRNIIYRIKFIKATLTILKILLLETEF